MSSLAARFNSVNPEFLIVRGDGDGGGELPTTGPSKYLGQTEDRRRPLPLPRLPHRRAVGSRRPETS
jgi:hypothetical protein